MKNDLSHKREEFDGASACQLYIRGADGLAYQLKKNPVQIQSMARFARLKMEDPGLRVVVKGADEADYQNMISGLDVLQQLDITKVGLATAHSATP